MKATILSVLMLCSILLVSCGKDKDMKKNCKMEECSICNDKKFEDIGNAKKATYLDQDGNQVDTYILSPLVEDADCKYIVSGKVKYLVNGETAAIVDYGDGVVDAWAVKTIYTAKNNNGKCGFGMGGCFGGKEEASTTCCKFEQECHELTNNALSKMSN